MCEALYELALSTLLGLEFANFVGISLSQGPAFQQATLMMLLHTKD